MPTYSAQDRLAAAQKAGFPDPLTATAISLAEFGANRDVNTQSQSDVFFQPGQHPAYPNGGQEQSFGPWQINLPAHPDVTRSCAMDLTCSTAAAYKISSGGTDFNPWTAFTSGAYKSELANLTAPFKNIIAQGDTGPAGPATGGGSSGGAPADCRVLSPLELIQIGDPTSHFSRMSGADIAAELKVTPECLKYRIGGFIGALDTVPGVKGGAEAKDAAGKLLTGNPIADALGAFMNAFRSQNLWRAAFVIVGVGAVFIGGRMYLMNSEAPQPREGVSG